jgi:glucose-6-phosphate isomerase
MADRLEQIVRGIWARDPRTWTDDTRHDRSIATRVGWLDVAEQMRQATGDLTTFADEVRREGFTHALLLGMGGSSLAPEVLRRTYGVRGGFLDLAVLDSTDPATILDLQRRLPADKTLYVVSTKSGTTTETLSFQRAFWQHTAKAVGAERAGRQFIAITDPGSKLERDAREHGYRRVFLNPEDIGGRYSALSFFGLVPAALIGVDLDALLRRAEEARAACAADAPITENPAAMLGEAMARHAAAGRDKVTLVCSKEFETFGYWVEQLIAESTGKEDKGIVPIEGEALGAPDVYGPDRFFVTVGVIGERVAALRALEAAGHPVLRLDAQRPADLGYQFYVWEFATAVAGAYLRINPFDEPNVQESKDNTTRVLKEFQEQGRLPAVPEVTVGEQALQPVADVLRQVTAGDYLSITAYVPRTEETEQALDHLRTALRDHLKVATTVGYGPRFLHSTGQLHKGGPNSGVFLQLVADDAADAPVPEAPYTFRTLKQAQAIGDLQALQAHDRRAVRVRIAGDPAASIRALATEIVPLFPWWEAGQTTNTAKG